MQRFILRLALPVLIFCSPAFGDELEKELSLDLRESRAIAAITKAKSYRGEPITADMGKLKAQADNIRAGLLLLQERYKTRVSANSSLNGQALDRQDATAGGLIKVLEEYLALIDAIPPDNVVAPSVLDRLLSVLNALAPPKKSTILGSLPYKHLGYPAKEPSTSPVVTPAYKGGDANVIKADTASTPEAPISKDISELAQSLNWNPVLIYEWVKNNVETEWYWGAMKGAEETLRQKRGNDADQSALLVALLRAGGFPARYVKGTMEFFPGIDRAKNLIGLDDPAKIYTFLQKAGIPVKPVIAAGRIANLQIEHLWVEAYIPYANYRGAVLDDQGKIWVALDTSIKPQGYTRTHGAGVPAELLGTFRNEYLGGLQTLTPLDSLKDKLNIYLTDSQPGKSWSDLTDKQVLVPDVLKILPGSLQFPQISITGEYQTLPEDLKHKLAITGTANGTELFSHTLDVLKVSNRRLALRYEPETVEDQGTIDSFGGLDNTPPYLVQLRPVLTLDGERLVVAQDGLPMGADYNLNIDVVTPNGTERINSNQITGNLAVIGIVSQNAQAPTVISEADDAEAILHKEAIGYIHRWNKSEEDLAALLGQRISRPTVTVATVGGQIDVTLLMDTPHDFQWKGLFLDAGYRRIETVGRNGNEQDFMRLSALEGSILENRIFEDDLKVDSVSTAKLLQLAATSGIPTIIDKVNSETVLPTLPFDDAVKTDLANAVNQGLTVTIPQNEFGYLNWSGIGYIKENLETGESGWMLSGQVAGGMTAWTPEQWDASAAKAMSAALRAPYSGKPNTNPEEAAHILKIPVTDLQVGTVGQQIKRPLQVKVIDNQWRPVQDVVVTYTIKAGGGVFSNNSIIATAKTDARGLASIAFTAGKQTSSNPVYWNTSGNTYSDQYGANIIDVSLSNGQAVDVPFTIYGKPDSLVQLRPTHGANIKGMMLSYAGFVAVVAEDKYGNPIANQNIEFKGGVTAVTGLCKGTTYDTTAALIVKSGDDCLNTSPTIRDAASCKNAGAVINDVTSSTGVWAGVILGGAPGATYPVTATATATAANGSPFTAQFSPATYDLTDCSETADPNAQLVVTTIIPTDMYGNTINAGKTGSTISLIAKEYLIKEGSRTVTEELSCDPVKLSCDKLVGNHTYSTIGDFIESAASFNKVPVNNLGNGLFQGNYTLHPGVNTILIEGLASYGADRSANSCAGCLKIKNEIRTLGAATRITVYGVDIAIKQPLNIMLDGQGRSRNNLKISYTINPPEYRALNAFIMLYKVIDKNGQKTLEQMEVIPVETQGSGFGTIARGYPFDETQTYVARVVLNYGSYVQIASDAVPLTFVKGALIPDYNHNRKIDQEDMDRSLNGDTYYFWVNDDDGNGDTEGTGIPGTGSAIDSAMLKVDGTRDLVDFFPVHLDIKEMFKGYDPAIYKYRLRNADSGLNYVVTELAPTESGEYLTGEKRGIEFVQAMAVAPTISITDSSYNAITSQYLSLRSAVLDQIQQDKGIVLIEGHKKTITPLVLEVYKGTELVDASVRLNLSIDGVEQMFRHKNLVEEGGGPSQFSIYHTGTEDRLTEPVNFPDPETISKNFVFVHGYNVNPQQARGTFAEIFKRSYWSGSKAKFWAITWYGYHSQIGSFTPDYHANVPHAIDTAPFLRDFLLFNVHGEITIAAHSLGNMVVSSMLSDNANLWDSNYSSTNSLAKIKNYFLIDAAVAIEAYDGAATRSPDMQHSDWLNYKQSLWPSEWHQLFVKYNPNDSRAKLTWRDRFLTRPVNTNYFNFFSSGEEVLGVMPLNTTITQLLVDEANQSGIYAWALQEKLKGGNPVSVDLIGNTIGGWGFNLDDYAEQDPFGRNTNNPISFILANNLPESDLKAKPFFKKGQNTELYSTGSIGSNYAANNMSTLLASAFPALTLPIGANEIIIEKLDFKFSKDNNFDMEKLFKNEKKDWPESRAPYNNWKHSDLKKVSYPFVYNLFDALVLLGGL